MKETRPNLMHVLEDEGEFVVVARSGPKIWRREKQDLLTRAYAMGYKFTVGQSDADALLFNNWSKLTMEGISLSGVQPGIQEYLTDTDAFRTVLFDIPDKRFGCGFGVDNAVWRSVRGWKYYLGRFVLLSFCFTVASALIEYTMGGSVTGNLGLILGVLDTLLAMYLLDIWKEKTALKNIRKKLYLYVNDGKDLTEAQDAVYKAGSGVRVFGYAGKKLSDIEKDLRRFTREELKASLKGLPKSYKQCMDEKFIKTLAKTGTFKKSDFIL